MPRHLRELEILVGRPVQKTELLSLKETEAVREQFKQMPKEPNARFEIPFEQRREQRFRAFLERLAKANPVDVFLWTPASYDCGLLQPIPFHRFRSDFPFDVNPEGILALLTSDFRDELLLDYSVEDDEQLLEVKVGGEHWGTIAL
jgi:hypothetical protein